MYNGRIDISHIVKAQEIILINLTNTIVQSIVMAYSHIYIVILGEEVRGVVWEKEGIISFRPDFPKYYICSKHFI